MGYPSEIKRRKKKGKQKMNENDKDGLLECFTPGDTNNIIEAKKLPLYEEEISKLGYIMLDALSDYFRKLERETDDPEKDAIELFFDCYDMWEEEKRRHEQINGYLVALGENEREEPIENRMVDALMSYFDGERCYDGNSYFRGLRDDKVTPEWRRLKLAQIEEYKGGKN